MRDFSIGSNQGTLAPWLIRKDGVYFKIKLNMLRETPTWAWTVAGIDAQVRVVGPMRANANMQTHSPEAPIEQRDSTLQ
jgi:hypothetical protein